MSERVFSEKVNDLLNKDLEQTGRPLLRMAICRVFDDVDKGTPIMEAMYNHYRLLQVPLYKIEDMIYEITGERIKAQAAGYPKFKHRHRKQIIDKETGEVKVVMSPQLSIGAIVAQGTCIQLPKVTPEYRIDVAPMEPLEAQIILRRREMNDIFKLYNTHYHMGDYVEISVQPKMATIRFLDSKYNVRMEISSEREQQTTTPEVKSVKAT